MKRRPLWYRLDKNHKPVPVEDEDITVWARSFESQRRVALDDVEGLWVSTIFLGIDHGRGSRDAPGYKAVLWETMVFDDTHGSGRSLDDLSQRYTSHDAALLGHKRTVAVVRRILQERAAKQGRGARPDRTDDG